MRKEPIVFLDIDGVCNNTLFFQNRKDKSSQIDPWNIENLNEIIRQTGAKIVVSSVWRIGKTIGELQKILNEHGFIGEVIDKTPRITEGLRGNEIYKWLKENGLGFPFRRYIILDDDSDMLLWQKDNYFHVERYCGLTPDLAYRVINFFKSFEL